MKKVLSILLAVVFIATMFIGCGKSSNKELTLANYLSEEDRLFLIADSIGYEPAKNSDVLAIVILKSDGTCMFCDTDKTLGELEQMEDSEIKEIAEKKYNELIKESTEKVYERIMNSVTVSVEEWEEEVTDYFYGVAEDEYNSSDANKDIERYLSVFLPLHWEGVLGNKFEDIVKKNILECYSTQDYKKTAENIYNELVECFETSEAYQIAKKGLDDFNNNPLSKYKIVVNTDSTGNNTDSEILVLQNDPTLVNDYSCVQDSYSFELSEVFTYPATDDGGFQI